MIMIFEPHTQQHFKAMRIKEGESFFVEYINKDYFNGEESIEKGEAKAILNENNIYFNVTDPYGMDKLIMEVKVLYKIKS
jgi:hypothetical protein